MFKLVCKAQNYAWGKKGLDSLVGQIHAKSNPEEVTDETCFAEFWMGDHPNGPSMVTIDSQDPVIKALIANDEFMQQNEGKTVAITELFKLNAPKFLGEKYLERFVP